MTKRKPNAKVGRPLKLTEKVFKRARKMFRRGDYVENVAAACGVSASGMRMWMFEGAKAQLEIEAGEEVSPTRALYARFLEESQRERARGINESLKGMEGLGRQDEDLKVKFQALKYRLAIADSRYTARNRSEVSGPEGKPIQVVGTVAEAIEAAIDATPEIIVDSEDDEE